jgi:hypothetical protein
MSTLAATTPHQKGTFIMMKRVYALRRVISATLLALALLCPAVAEAANRFGVCTTACTWDASNTGMWSATSGGATGASVPGSSDTVTFDAATCVGGTTCTITVNTNPTIQSLTMGACTASTTGCIVDFSVNNNNVTINTNNGFSNSGTGTRTLNLGNGTWTLNTTNAGWNQATVTNLTFNANSSTIVFSGTLTAGNIQSIALGGFPYNTIRFSGNSTASGVSLTNTGSTIALLDITGPSYITLTGTGAMTITTMTVGAKTTLLPSSGQTLTFTNAPTLTGTASAPIGIIGTDARSLGSVATISVSSGTMSGTYVSIANMAFTGGATFSFTGFDLGRVTGATITAPAGCSCGRIIGG